MRTGFVFTLEHWNLYDFSKAWRAMTTGTHDEKLAKMADPALREAMVADEIRHKDAYRKLRPGVGGSIENLVVQDVAGRAGAREVRRALAGRHRHGARTSTPAR